MYDVKLIILIKIDDFKVLPKFHYKFTNLPNGIPVQKNSRTEGKRPAEPMEDRGVRP